MINKYSVLALLLAVASINVKAQNTMLLHNGSNVMYQTAISDVDSVKFANSNTYIHQNASNVNFPDNSIDSITFSTSTTGDRIYIIYDNSNVTIINPFASQGITITASQGHVTSSSTIATADIEYNILGNSANGSLVLSSAQPVKLILSNLSLTNPSGAAFKITGAMTSTVHLSGGTANVLSDAAASTDNGTLQAESNIVIEGTGALAVSGIKKHGIYSNAGLTLSSGHVSITQAASDGIHTNSYIQNGGTATISSTSDGIDAGTELTINNGTLTVNAAAADMKGLKSGGAININGGTIDVTVSGAQSKGLSATGNITMDAGTLTVAANGATVLEASGSGFDPSYCSAVKTDGNIFLNGGTAAITLSASNNGGRGLSSAGNITINGSNVSITTAGSGATYRDETGTTDSYSSSCIKADRHIYLLSGVINCSSSGSGGKGISADSSITIGNLGSNDSLLIVNVTTSGSRFLVTGSGQNADYANPKAVKAETNLTVNSGIININCTQSEEGGEGLESKNTLYIKGGKITANTYDDCVNATNYIEVSGGTHSLTARGNDGMDSNGDLTISGGFTISSGARAPEEGFDCDNNTFKVSGGIMIGTGGATSNPTTGASTQNSLKITTTASVAVCVKNASDQVILMYQAPAYTTTGGGGGPGGGGNTMVILFSDPNLVNGTYTIQYGGTISGGTTTNGYNTGGSYTGGSSRSVTVNSRLTSVSL